MIINASSSDDLGWRACASSVSDWIESAGDDIDWFSRDGSDDCEDKFGLSNDDGYLDWDWDDWYPRNDTDG